MVGLNGTETNEECRAQRTHFHATLYQLRTRGGKLRETRILIRVSNFASISLD